MVKQPNSHTCLITAAAIVLREDVNTLIEEVGHDGSEIYWPEETYPYNVRGHHYYEIVRLCLARGLAPVLLEFTPSVWRDGKRYVLATQPDLLKYGGEGILISDNHAWAYVGGQIIDPTTGGAITQGNFIYYMKLYAIKSKIEPGN